MRVANPTGTIEPNTEIDNNLCKVPLPVNIFLLLNILIFAIIGHHPDHTLINIPKDSKQMRYFLLSRVNILIVLNILIIQFSRWMRIRSRYWKSCFFKARYYYFRSVMSPLRYQNIVYSYYIFLFFLLCYVMLL